jgi:hypothetical protein
MPAQNQTAYFFDTAVMPRAWTICGVPLRPFCLGHYLILRHFCSPLSNDTETDVNPEDGIYWLFHALLVCGLSFEDNVEMHNDDKLLQKTCTEFSDNLLKNIAIDKSWNIYAQLKHFKDYMNWHMAMPMYTEENPSKKAPTGLDWVQNLFVTFKSKLGYSETEIMNMNFRKLFYEWCSYAESEGAISVANKTTLQQYAIAKGLI